MKIEIEDLKKVEINKNDVLILSSKDTMSIDSVACMLTRIEEVFPDNKCIYLDKGTELNIKSVKEE